MMFIQGKKIYCIGIKGAGLTAFAELLSKKNITVLGSDTTEVFFTDSILRRANILVHEGFAIENIPKDCDVIVYSTAYSAETNIEVAHAMTLQVPVMSYPEAIGELMRENLSLAVCGTHGKTTTSALLAEAMVGAGEDVSAIIGSAIKQWSGSSRAGNGKYFILEADEYQNKLQYYSPYAAILTSIDFDHPDYFKDFAAYKKVFTDMIERIPQHGYLISWGDSAHVSDIAQKAHCKTITYGFLEQNDFRIIKYAPTKDFAVHGMKGSIKQSFEITYNEESLGVFELQLAGEHNALNATAVIAMCVQLQLDVDNVRGALRKFEGTERRFEYIGQYKDALLYDDYAHHPEEIRVTLKAVRDLYPEKRIIAVFHPHTFTRTKALLAEFAQSFDDANLVYVLDIYGSAREEQGGVSSQSMVDLMNSYTRGKSVYIPTIPEVIEELRIETQADDIIIALGAGNVWEVVHHLSMLEEDDAEEESVNNSETETVSAKRGIENENTEVDGVEN